MDKRNFLLVLALIIVSASVLAVDINPDQDQSWGGETVEYLGAGKLGAGKLGITCKCTDHDWFIWCKNWNCEVKEMLWTSITLTGNNILLDCKNNAQSNQVILKGNNTKKINCLETETPEGNNPPTQSPSAQESNNGFYIETETFDNTSTTDAYGKPSKVPLKIQTKINELIKNKFNALIPSLELGSVIQGGLDRTRIPLYPLINEGSSIPINVGFQNGELQLAYGIELKKSGNSFIPIIKRYFGGKETPTELTPEISVKGDTIEITTSDEEFTLEFDLKSYNYSFVYPDLEKGTVQLASLSIGNISIQDKFPEQSPLHASVFTCELPPIEPGNLPPTEIEEIEAPKEEIQLTCDATSCEEQPNPEEAPATCNEEPCEEPQASLWETAWACVFPTAYAAEEAPTGSSSPEAPSTTPVPSHGFYSIELWALTSDEATQLSGEITNTTDAKWASKENKRDRQFIFGGTNCADAPKKLTLNTETNKIIDSIDLINTQKTCGATCKKGNYPSTAPTIDGDAKKCWGSIGSKWKQTKTNPDYSLQEFLEYIKSKKTAENLDYYLVVEYSQDGHFNPTANIPVYDLIKKIDLQAIAQTNVSDACTKCASIQQCIACMNQKIVNSLWGTESRTIADAFGSNAIVVSG
ncbi:MAG: hypothetical protein ABIA76_01590 [Candidatus Diapherotrites archaeon]